ncbi:hypothetical protein ACSBR1_041846 [Camellia fascicularis]
MLKDITQKKSVAKVLDFMRKFTRDRELSGPAITRFVTNFIAIESIEFWQKATELCKVHEPLERVLRLVDGDEKPTMGFIHKAIDKAKLAIKRDCRYYTEY